MRRTDDTCPDSASNEDWSDRAQSEALGFALLFGAILLILGLIVTVGYGNLVEARDHEQVNNAERGFESLAVNVEDLVRNDAPSRSTELAVADGRLVTRTQTTITITWSKKGSSTNTSRTFNLTTLVYDPGTGEQVVYEAGAVFRGDDAGSVMVREPYGVLNGSTTIVPIVQLYGTERVGVSGTKTVLLRTERNETASAVLVGSGANHTVTIEITSPRVDAWERYFATQPGDPCTLSTNATTVTCSMDTTRIVLIRVGIDIREQS